MGFGATERETGFCFLQIVEDRRRETLENLIQKFILPGSTILSDGWASYINIENIDYGNYQYEVVLHKYNFVDSDDALMHTQQIENSWMLIKTRLRHQYGASKKTFILFGRSYVEKTFSEQAHIPKYDFMQDKETILNMKKG
ncbi:hypothetical protein SteCoe_24576 [Stentor coeruleus]|uniref:ISXO2-like transposase domain-containing protein n=1 Tax=Stentor coeruleus TaxID=5963 RepID=A0A1R2BH75_9CILI|nr:hypothetical protein SteCoe_24576 [Stentor coeruleus]